VLFPQLAGRKGVAASKLRALTSPLRHFGKQNQLRLFPNFTTETTSIAAPTALPFASKRFLFSVKVPPRLRLLSQNNPEKQTGFAPKPCFAFPPLRSTQQGACLFASALQPDNETNPALKPDFAGPPLCHTAATFLFPAFAPEPAPQDGETPPVPNPAGRQLCSTTDSLCRFAGKTSRFYKLFVFPPCPFHSESLCLT
jgi:hypothetical protein